MKFSVRAQSDFCAFFDKRVIVKLPKCLAPNSVTSGFPYIFAGMEILKNLNITIDFKKI